MTRHTLRLPLSSLRPASAMNTSTNTERINPPSDTARCSKPVAEVKVYECTACDITYFTLKGLQAHLQSATHLRTCCKADARTSCAPTDSLAWETPLPFCHTCRRFTIPSSTGRPHTCPSYPLNASVPPEQAVTDGQRSDASPPFGSTPASHVAQATLYSVTPIQDGMVDQGIASEQHLATAEKSFPDRPDSEDGDMNSSSTGTDTSSDTESQTRKQHGTTRIQRYSRTISVVQRDSRLSGNTNTQYPSNATASASSSVATEPVPLVPPRIPQRPQRPFSSRAMPSFRNREREPTNRDVGDRQNVGFGCSHCRQRFELANRLITHIRDLHQDIKRYVCSGCNTPFATAARFREHLSACSMQGRLSSREDGGDQASGATLPQEPRDDGVRQGRPEAQVKDGQSDPNVSAAGGDATSTRQPLRYKYYCPPPCDRVYKSVDTLTQHRSKYHPSAQFTCTTCQDEFSTPQKLKNHLMLNPRHMQIGLAKPTLTPVARTKRTRPRPPIGSADAPIKLESDSSSEDDVPRVGAVQSAWATKKVGSPLKGRHATHCRLYFLIETRTR